MRAEPLMLGVIGALGLGLGISAALNLGDGAPAPAAPKSTAALLRLLDDDGDGRVNGEELRRHADRLGPSLRFDLDQDGALDLAELDLALRSLSPHPPQPNALPGAL
jgi:hypothetical protein